MWTDIQTEAGDRSCRISCVKGDHMHSSYRNISDNIGPPTLAQALYLSAGAADKTHIIVRRAQHPDYWEKSDKMGVNTNIEENDRRQTSLVIRCVCYKNYSVRKYETVQNTG